MQAILMGKLSLFLGAVPRRYDFLFLTIILALFENILLIQDFVTKFPKAFEKEFWLSMQFFVRTGLIFISQALSRAQMFPIALITARGAGTRSQKERPAPSLWAAPVLSSHPAPTTEPPAAWEIPCNGEGGRHRLVMRGQCLKLSFPGRSHGGDHACSRPGESSAKGKGHRKCRPGGCLVSWAPHHRLSMGHVSLGWETFLLFVTGINRFYNVGFFFFFYEGNSSADWASALNFVTSAPSIVRREAGEIQHGFSREVFKF